MRIILPVGQILFKKHCHSQFSNSILISLYDIKEETLNSKLITANTFNSLWARLYIFPNRRNSRSYLRSRRDCKMTTNSIKPTIHRNIWKKYSPITTKFHICPCYSFMNQFLKYRQNVQWLTVTLIHVDFVILIFVMFLVDRVD